MPAGWGFQEAAGLFVTAPTSYGALVVRAGVKKGDWVLVHAAAGGVGLAAVQGKQKNSLSRGGGGICKVNYFFTTLRCPEAFQRWWISGVGG